MKISLVMLQSLDGIISTGPDDNLKWGTKEDKKYFQQKAEEADCLIMGLSTFITLPAVIYKEKKALVFSFNPKEQIEYVDKYPNLIFFSGTPKEGVKELENIGVENALLMGGGSVNGQFVKSGLLDDIYITIAPKIFGKGVKIFGDKEMDVDLKLVSIEKFTENEILVHYSLKK